MAINFPNSPSIGQTVVLGDAVYIWTGTVWNLSTSTAAIVESVSGAGTTQGTATLVSSSLILVTTAAANSGVRLPTDVTGRRVIIRNSGANSLRVYPSTGAQINELGTNSSFILDIAATIEFVGFSSTQWYTINSTFA
jgi:hypothetical protein